VSHYPKSIYKEGYMKRYTFSLLFLALVFLALSLGVRAEDNPQSSGVNANSETLFHFRGGPAKETFLKIEDEPTEIFEDPAFVALPGATLSFNTDERDLVVVDFSGECRLFGAVSDDWVLVEVHLDGVPLEPHTPDPGDTLAFCGDDNWNSHSIKFAGEVKEKGAHTVEVFWKLIDSSPEGELRGWLDDWTLSAVIFD
jgi:hypothetical protein